MTKILLSGCSGVMGKMTAETAASAKDCEIVAGLDINESDCAFPVFSSPSEIDVDCDVIIDFSHPAALKGLLEFALSKKIPVVLATTGYSEEQIAEINDASKKIPVFFSANMSLGVNLISELVAKAASILGDDFDIEIVEAHHNRKLDAPSGTAVMLAKSVEEGLDFEPEYEYNRHARRQKRPHNEIGMHSIRGGTIVGEHQVIFAGNDEIVTISHSARSRRIFSYGAVNAAKFLIGKNSGLYSMKDMIG